MGFSARCIHTFLKKPKEIQQVYEEKQRCSGVWTTVWVMEEAFDKQALERAADSCHQHHSAET